MIAAQRAEIDRRLTEGLTTQVKVDETCAALDMELDEYVNFQNLKSLAVADGTLTPEEGQLVYAYLGESPTTFNNQPVEVKAILTKLHHELLGRTIRARSVAS